MSVILARPNGGTGAIGVTTITTITPSSTNTVDALDTTLYRAAKWFITVTRSSDNAAVAYEIYGMHRNGANPLHTRYGVMGDSISHNVDVIITGGDLEVDITNNELGNIVVDVTRLQVIV